MEGTRISVVSVPVSKPDVAKAFYVDMLGFDLLMDNDFGRGMRWVMLRPPGAETAVTLVTWFDTMPPGSLRGTVLSVPDIEGTAADLRAKKVLEEDEEIQTAPWGRWVSVEDPDGNGWIIQQDAEGPIEFT